MPWPKIVAAKIISGYIARKYDMDAINIRRFNPPMGAMPFFNNSASSGIRDKGHELFAGSLLKFLAGLEIPFEDGGSAKDAMSELVGKMSNEETNSSEIVTVIDKHYRFRDEE